LPYAKLKTNRPVRVAVIILYLSAAPAFINADITIDESVSYYDITGTSVRELRESIYANSLVDRATNGFDASTNWSISSQFEYLAEASGCKITSADIRANIVYRLPRWQAIKDSTDTELTAKWRGYIDNLTRHESIHGDMTRDAVSTIETTLLSLHTTDTNLSCDALKTKAYASIDRLIAELKQRHEKFDVDTNHGTKTGAVLP